jgi:hypothetical protein
VVLEKGDLNKENKKRMLKRCALFIKGFIRPQFLLIVLILLVTVYFYQGKVREMSGQFIESNRKSGALFYAEGIWNKMRRIQQISDGRSQRAMELFEETKSVSDKSKSFSVKVPKSWNIVSEEGARGNQISKIVIDSPSFSQREEGGDIFYDDGAEFSIQVVRGEQTSAKLPDGGHGSLLIKKQGIDVVGERINYHVISDVVVKEGEIIDAHFLHGGNTYNFRLVDNPKIFTGGEFSFQEILLSLNF